MVKIVMDLPRKLVNVQKLDVQNLKHIGDLGNGNFFKY
jgi:hypothetical protein